MGCFLQDTGLKEIHYEDALLQVFYTFHSKLDSVHSINGTK